ncbi:AMIN domain-containing protein [Oculatella sp. LEGE 06141]|nr:type IV pilus secretin family protein [Oculatella sp. LEGE 06141]MBE9179913.1 AMIN domain-containing protein [Oculatella sp. LEGE 06141]
MAAQAATAAPTQVTNVEVNQTNGGIELVLRTQAGDRPQIFTVSRGNTLVADIINTQLTLAEGNGFLQNNPAPGISSVVVSQLDSNSVRVTVAGEANAPAGEVSQSGRGIVLSFNPNGSEAAQAAPSNPGQGATAQAPAPAPSPQAPLPTAPTPDVVVPNPEISIEGVPLPGTAPNQRLTPPLAPRAIAPPLGDIAVSNIDASPEAIDLGTGERVPRLVLRDAPVRDVLSLLARAAGLNVAYIGEDVASEGQEQQVVQQPGAVQEVRISLDIENEPVQDVFNYVLRVSGLEANRTGRTIFVGPRLPDDARNVVARTLRMNQVNAADAAGFLTAQGAETQITRDRIEVQTFGEGAAARNVETSTPEVIALRASGGDGPLLLRGLSVVTNARLNTITLVGTPRKIEIASQLLSQLDLRQRQVAINVKVVDVNLLATEDFSTSFSFGVGDSFFVSDGGAASFNFGDTRPPTTAITRNSVLSAPVTATPFPATDDELGPFFDAQPDAPFGNSTGNPSPPLSPNFPFGQLPRAPFGTDENPLQPGITEITEDGIEIGLPQLFQYPTRFLASLQAQVVSGNAKILTDPTIVVQEGETATVQLTQQIPTNIITTFDDETGRSTTQLQLEDAGVILQVNVNRIDDNGFVTMAIAPTVSAPSESRNFQDTQITLLAERTLQSGRLRVRDGQTLIVSGIIQESDRTTVSKIPILGDIPILGALFRSTNRENQRNEVIILLTPQILDDSDTSGFGYQYTPGRATQDFLQQRGVPSP